MTRFGTKYAVALAIFLALPSTHAQDASTVPSLVKYSGIVEDASNHIVGITFALYKDEQGRIPLWVETQNVPVDGQGHFTVQLGSTLPEGLPKELFATGEARWLGVQPQGQPEQPRVLLLSVPYALKAADAQTLGGLPASAFALASSREGTVSPQSVADPAGNAEATSNLKTTNVTTSGGTANTLPLFTTGTNIQNSAIAQAGSGTAAKVGIATTAPSTTLDVNGSATIRGALGLPAIGTATTAAGKISRPLIYTASAFNSGTATAVNQKFQWQAEAVGNNSPTATGSLNLLYGSGSATPAETGLKLNSKGLFTFAPGQTFPGAGTITGVTPGTALTGGGTAGRVTLNLDTTKVPLLAAANMFTGNQSINGSVSATSFTGSGAGLTNLPGANVSGTVATATNAANLGGLPASAYQPAGSYATLGANTFSGNQTVTGSLTTSGTIHGGAASFSGAVNVAGITLPAAGTATAALPFNSQPLDMAASAFNSSTARAANADFRWLAEFVGQNTSSPSGMLNLLFGGNGAAPTETGLSIASNGQVKFAGGQTFPGAGTITGVTAASGLTGGGTSGSVTLKLDTSFSDGRYAQLGANNAFAGSQIFGNSVGIGVAPAYPLHVNGTMRAETGLSLGGNAFLGVDAPGIFGGHFIVTADGLVGIRNPNPKNALDVLGNISTNSGVEAGNAIIGGPLSAGSVQIGGDQTMSAAPHLYLTGYVPGPMAALTSQVPIISIPSKGIMVTRMVALGLNTCPQAGALTFDLATATATLNTLTLSAPSGINDSGALSIAIAAGTPFWGRVNPPDCGAFGTAPSQIAISIEYVMR